MIYKMIYNMIYKMIYDMIYIYIYRHLKFLQTHGFSHVSFDVMCPNMSDPFHSRTMTNPSPCDRPSEP